MDGRKNLDIPFLNRSVEHIREFLKGDVKLAQENVEQGTSVVYVFLLFVHAFLTLSMYSYCCLCIRIVRPCILNVVYVFLLLSMYSYCSSMHS